MNKSYSIGLDIGTNSVGYAIMNNEDYTVPVKKMRVMGNTNLLYSKKPLIGALLFDEGESAADRRLSRTNRRRYNRRRNRLLYLQEIFQNEINKIDENFFHRLNESFLIENDKKFSKYPIFGNQLDEKQYHEKFKTIYHLRRELADGSKQADLRLVYLALAHILKNRGHFLEEGDIDVENIGVQSLFDEFLTHYNQLFGTKLVVGQSQVEVELTSLLSRARKAEAVLKLFPQEKSNGKLAQFLKLIVGNQADFKAVYELDDKTTLQFSKDTYEEDLEKLLAKVDENQTILFDLAKKVYDAILLSGILTVKEKSTKAPLSASMVQRYEEHEADLKALKAFFMTHLPKDYKTMFKDKSQKGYAGYIEGLHKMDKNGNFIQTSKPVSQEEFYKFTKKLIGNVPEGQEFLKKMEQEIFLRKQRTFDNGAIPYQVQLKELTAIIKRQGQYYPFLLENQDKIESILTFRIPYYVGPLARGGSDFAWIERKSDEAIRPWNFEELVDLNVSAAKFIERMTINDLYLPTEKVLPRHSLIYEQYTVYNELTKVRFVAEGITEPQYFTGEQKKEIFNTLFKQSTRVTEKKLKDYLTQVGGFKGVEIEGVKEQFNANFATYHDLKKVLGREFLDEEENQEVLEGIIHTLTIFEDQSMIKQELSKFSNFLTPKQIKDLSRKKYTGWGRFSRKLLHGIKDRRTGNTILEFLKDDGLINRNLMQLIRDDNLDFKKIITEAQVIRDTTDNQTMVSEIAGSPAIKKGILQSLNIVDELIKVMGYKPTHIVVEMARENQTTQQGQAVARERLKKIAEGIEALNGKVLDKHPIKDNSILKKEKKFLYYLQDGKDMYTGLPLNFDDESLKTYDIDHIVPQSFLKDNSIDNKVLTTSKENRKKLNDVPSQEIVKSRIDWWRKLHKAGLVSDKKFAYLTKGELTIADKAGFINRQLVETRQITKHVARILDEKFNTVNGKGKRQREVEVITLKSVFASRFRSAFHLYKVRELNDYHHAHDAYLNAVVTKALLTVYPKLKKELVYGDYYHESIFDKKRLSATERLEMYNNILQFFHKEHKIEEETEKLLWDKKALVKVVNKVLYDTPVTIVRKPEISKGALFKSSNKAVGYNNNLIPRKTRDVYLDVTKYGGFIEPSEVYAVAILTIGTKGKFKNKSQVVLRGISLLEQKEFEKDNKAFLGKAGYMNIQKVIKLPKYSLFTFESGRRRYMITSGELQKGNQLQLPRHLISLLYHAQRFDDLLKREEDDYNLEEHRAEFGELLDYIGKYNGQYIQADNNYEKIKAIYEKNKDTNIRIMAESFVNLLNFTQMRAAAAFTFFGETIDRKRYVSPSECTTATLIHQSVTGLYETRIDLSKLGGD